MRFNVPEETASGRRTSWCKHITSVDTSKSNGYAFDGSFLKNNVLTELPEGSVIVQVYPCGSVKNGYQRGRLFRIEGEELVEHIDEDWRDSFLLIRDKAEELLGNQPASPLAGFSDEDLIAEIKRRGICLEES